MKGFIPLGRLSNSDLRQIVETAERKRGRATTDTSDWPRSRLVSHIEAYAPPAKQKRARRPRMAKNLGVGKFCQELLARVVGQTVDGLPIGLSYNVMVATAQKKFPDSCVDERHLRWYAAKMRREDHLIPVHRGRSKWQ